MIDGREITDLDDASGNGKNGRWDRRYCITRNWDGVVMALDGLRWRRWWRRDDGGAAAADLNSRASARVFVGCGGWDQAWRRLRYRFRGVGAAAVVAAEAKKRWWRAWQREHGVAGDVGRGRHGVECWCWRGPTAIQRRS